jgi:hypothetical protein
MFALSISKLVVVVSSPRKNRLTTFELANKQLCLSPSTSIVGMTRSPISTKSTSMHWPATI